MIKLILLIFVIYAFFKIRKVMKRLGETVSRSFPETANNTIDDVMVKDPVCEVYFPKREGLHLNDNGIDLYFCSSTCRDKYIAAK